ncbi:MAG TPA: hypothetical protein DCS55_16490 [Acidimicrobiaceae bacterium]|nr:hypothetical protein [Acidimicrobiaceae bacterium]
MVEPQPSWVKWVVAALVLGVAAVVVFGPFGTEADPVAAEWEVDADADLDPATSTVPILVNERECASGASAEGRIEVTVDYRPDEVAFDVGVRPRGGDQECPSNPTTPYTVELDEPLGDRSIVGERPISD